VANESASVLHNLAQSPPSAWQVAVQLSLVAIPSETLLMAIREPAVAKLKVGEVSDPFLIERYDPLKLRYMREAYAVVKIEDIRPSTLPSFEEALPQVRSTYLSAHRVEIEERVQMQILNSINATILEDRL
jgi:hypothetical protein